MSNTARLIPYLSKPQAPGDSPFKHSNLAPADHFVHKTAGIIQGIVFRSLPLLYCLMLPLKPSCKKSGKGFGKVTWKLKSLWKSCLRNVFLTLVGAWALSYNITFLSTEPINPFLVLQKRAPETQDMLQKFGAALKAKHSCMYLNRGDPTIENSLIPGFSFSFFRTGTLMKGEPLVNSVRLTLSLAYEDSIFVLAKNPQNKWVISPISLDLTMGHEIGHGLAMLEDFSAIEKRMKKSSPLWENEEEARNNKVEVALARAIGENERLSYRGFLGFDNKPKIMQLLEAFTIGADETVHQLIQGAVNRHAITTRTKVHQAEIDDLVKPIFREKARASKVSYAVIASHPKSIAYVAGMKKKLETEILEVHPVANLLDLDAFTPEMEIYIAETRAKSIFNLAEKIEDPEERAFFVEQRGHIQDAYCDLIAGLKAAGHPEKAARILAIFDKEIQRVKEACEEQIPNLKKLQEDLEATGQKIKAWGEENKRMHQEAWAKKGA